MNYTVQQVSEMLGVTQETIRRSIRKGSLNATKNSRKEGFIISNESLSDYCEKHPLSNRRRIKQNKHEEESIKKIQKILFNIKKEISEIEDLLSRV